MNGSEAPLKNYGYGRNRPLKRLQRCEEDCHSRQICGEDACACVRAIFPTPQHYEFYLETREFFLQSLAGATFAAVVSEKIGDKKA